MSKSSTMEQRSSFQQIVLEQLGIHIPKKEKEKNLDRFYTLHKHKMGHRPKFNTQYCKILEDNMGENLDDFRYGSDLLFRYDTNGMIHERNN